MYVCTYSVYVYNIYIYIYTHTQMWQCLAPEELGARAKPSATSLTKCLPNTTSKKPPAGWLLGREQFSDCHLVALAQARFELLRLSAQEESLS